MAKHHDNQTWLLILISGSFFITQLDVSIVNIALPAIQDKLKANTRQLQWVIDTYTLLLASLQLTGGKLSDKFGARLIYLLSLPLFTLASALCGLAGSMPVLLTGRTIQGLAAALMLPASLSLLNTSYANRPDKAKAIANFITAGAIALAAGPLIGGLLIHSYGWQSIFWVNVPIGLVISLLCIRYLPAPAVIPTKINGYAQGLSMVFLFSLTFILIELQQLQRNLLLAVLLPVVCLSSLGLLILAEKRTTQQFIPWHLFRKRAFSSPLVIGFILNFSSYAAIFILSLYLQSYLKYSSQQTGLIFFPMMGMVIVGNQLSGRMITKYGEVPLIKAGLLIGVAGMLGIVACTFLHPLVYLLVAELFTGFGLAFTVPVITHLFLNNIPDNISGIGSGILNTFRQVGGAMGVAITGSILSLPLEPIDTFRLALALCCAVYAVGIGIRTKKKRGATK